MKKPGNNKPTASFALAVIIALSAGLFTDVTVVCPICNKAGVLLAPTGMKIDGVSNELIDYECLKLGCTGVYATFTYEIKYTLINESVDVINGYLVAGFYAVDMLNPSFEIPIYVEMQPNKIQDFDQIITYSGWMNDLGYDPYTMYPTPHRLEVETRDGMICPHCDGKGKLPLIDKLKLKVV